jgi:RNA polymerase sigma factor (sigma-70 family)
LKTATSRQSTAELVSRCRGGDERSWRLLVQRYENLVYSTALGIGLDTDSAAEVHQRVWLELHRSLERLQNPSGLPKWLIVTTRRLAYEHAVRSRRITHELGEDLVDPSPSSQAVIEQMEAAHRLQVALDRMKGRCRDLLAMLFFEEPRPRYEEVASRLNVAVGTLGAMRGRCLERLRELVEEEQ